MGFKSKYLCLWSQRLIPAQNPKKKKNDSRKTLCVVPNGNLTFIWEQCKFDGKAGRDRYCWDRVQLPCKKTRIHWT